MPGLFHLEYCIIIVHISYIVYHSKMKGTFRDNRTRSSAVVVVVVVCHDQVRCQIIQSP